MSLLIDDFCIADTGLVKGGVTIIVSATIPSVTDPEPDDYSEALQEIKQIQPFTPLKIYGVRVARNKRWYNTDYGYINEIALYGKEVQIEKDVK